METKNSIRKSILSLRDGLSETERVNYSRRITDTILQMPMIIQADTVLAFAGYKSEVQTLELIQQLLSHGKKVYLPKVTDEEMDFYRIERLEDLEAGYKGIPEPGKVCMEVFCESVYDKTVMLMPGAVFGMDGSRIGYGKGYYDRFLAKCDIMNRIALCFSFQLLEHIPSNAHDKKASVIVTEKGITECRKVLF